MNIKKLLRKFKRSKYLFMNLWSDEPQPTEIRVSNWGSSSSEKDKRLAKKPIDIYEEIISEEPKINLTDLDGQIKLVKERMKVFERHTKNDLAHEKMAIHFLKSRKKYEKEKHLFRWSVTNQTLIDKLCKRYKVQMVDLGSYYRLVPREGVDEIEKFAENMSRVSRSEPLFKLIISDEERPKDPILLAQSPFGNWFYVLGAWDKEVEIVDKLIYKGE